MCRVRIELKMIYKFFFQKNTPACSCVDCEQSCPVPPPAPPLPQPFLVFGYDGYEVIMTIIFVCGTCLFLFLVVCFSHRKRIGKKLRLVYLKITVATCITDVMQFLKTISAVFLNILCELHKFHTIT